MTDNIIQDVKENKDAFTKVWLFIKKWGIISTVILVFGYIGGYVAKWNIAYEAKAIAQTAVDTNTRQDSKIADVDRKATETAVAVAALSKEIDEFKKDNKDDHKDIKADVKEIRRLLENRITSDNTGKVAIEK